MLCLEDISQLDKFAHYERGLESRFRIAVRQARCANVASAMAEVDIVAEAHQANAKLLPKFDASLHQCHSLQPLIWVWSLAMQISMLRQNRHEPERPRGLKGLRQGRNKRSSIVPLDNGFVYSDLLQLWGPCFLARADFYEACIEICIGSTPI